MNHQDHRPPGLSSSLASKGMLWPVCLLVLGFVFITLHQSDYFHAIPGDMGDARFNIDILEHLFRWVTGKDPSLWSPPYFYPYPGTLTLSDNHFGSGLAYVLMRLLGLGPEGAFIGWYTLAAPLNFIGCYYALRHSGLSRQGSAIGAFVFTFALNVSAQHGHAQLAYRFCIPLAMLAAHRLLETRAPRQIALIVLWVTWQFYCSIYLGYFLALLLIAYAVMHTVLKPADNTAKPHQAIASAVRNALTNKAWGSIATVFFCLVALALMFYPYMHYSRLYQLSRGYAEIRSMLPRPQSYLLSDGSLIWRTLSQHITNIPMRWEHQMFFGASACILAAIGIRSAWNRAAKVALGAILLLIMLTLYVHGHSLYALIYNLPLANAIRGVTRIGLVIIFPVAYLAGRGVDWLLEPGPRRLPKAIAASVLIAFMMVEYTAYSTQMVPIKDIDQRLGKLLALVPSSLPADAILYVPPRTNDTGPSYNELDGMRLVAATNRVTLNGYSGSVPNGFSDPGLTPCDVVNNRLANYSAFVGGSHAQYVQLMRRVVVLGQKEPCAPLETLAKRTHFAGSIPKNVVAATELDVTHPRMTDGKLVATLQIINHSRETLHSISDDDHPIRFSWRIVSTHDEPGPFDGWTTRKNLAADVDAGKSESTDVLVDPPRTPGIYRVEASLVQENVLWFHQYGMPIAHSAENIEVKADGSVTILPSSPAP
ncbi:MAG: hypothetical protein J0I96_10425 [Rhodanobacter sp.]|nr:hypothetical protein [Rhodanobacter sp.]